MTREKDREKKKLLTQRKMRLVDRRAMLLGQKYVDSITPVHGC